MATSVQSKWTSAFDLATHAINVVNYEHHEIHAGRSYVTTWVQDVGNGGTVNFTLKTPDSARWVHMLWEVESELESDLKFYEGSTGVSGGGTVTAYNRNRNSEYTSECVAVGTPTVGTVGTLLFQSHMGGGSASARFGGEDRGINEWVLKPNMTYLLQMVNATSSNNYMTIHLDWYEHTNKES